MVTHLKVRTSFYCRASSVIVHGRRYKLIWRKRSKWRSRTSPDLYTALTNQFQRNSFVPCACLKGLVAYRFLTTEKTLPNIIMLHCYSAFLQRNKQKSIKVWRPKCVDLKRFWDSLLNINRLLCVITTAMVECSLALALLTRVDLQSWSYAKGTEKRLGCK